MKILLDENMPHDLVRPIRLEGHKAESVHTLGIAGVENGELYRIVRDEYDLLFTKDAAFNEWAKKVKEDHRVRYVLVMLPQASQDILLKTLSQNFVKPTD